LAGKYSRAKLAKKYRSVPRGRSFGKKRGKGLKRRARQAEKLLFLAAVALVLVLLLKLVIGVVFKTGNTSINLSDVEAMRIPIASVEKLNELSGKYGVPLADMLTVYSVENKFFPEKNPDIDTSGLETQFAENFDKIKAKYSSSALKPFEDLFSSIIGDIKCFPVKSDPNDSEIPYIYSDSWGALRTEGCDRAHEGCDVLDRDNVRGRLQVVSMTDGTVKDCGWTQLGGYCLGIVAGSGNYYYYAHLERYADGIGKGAAVKAGDLLGYMGDSGYGKEGTVGQFPVHLHVGIYPAAKITSKEYAVNPYPFLRLAEMEQSGGNAS